MEDFFVCVKLGFKQFALTTALKTPAKTFALPSPLI
jgi:hypothetical protein